MTKTESCYWGCVFYPSRAWDMWRTVIVRHLKFSQNRWCIFVVATTTITIINIVVKHRWFLWVSNFTRNFILYRLIVRNLLSPGSTHIRLDFFFSLVFTKGFYSLILQCISFRLVCFSTNFSWIILVSELGDKEELQLAMRRALIVPTRRYHKLC